jgi:hypothetical protein
MTSSTSSAKLFPPDEDIAAVLPSIDAEQLYQYVVSRFDNDPDMYVCRPYQTASVVFAPLADMHCTPRTTRQEMSWVW